MGLGWMDGSLELVEYRAPYGANKWGLAYKIQFRQCRHWKMHNTLKSRHNYLRIIHMLQTSLRVICVLQKFSGDYLCVAKINSLRIICLLQKCLNFLPLSLRFMCSISFLTAGNKQPGGRNYSGLQDKNKDKGKINVRQR